MMRALHLLSLGVALATGLPAQTTVTSPNLPSVQNVDAPWSTGIGSYQQWYSLASLQSLPTPMRIERVEFFAGTSLTATATTIDCEILMGHGNASGVAGAFASNYSSPPVVVLPRQNVNLLAGAPGAVVLNIPFTTRFTWDRARPIVLEVRVHGNGLNSQPFLYNFRGSTAAFGVTSRVYQGGSPAATNGQVTQAMGLTTRFTARPGVLLEYGTGCAGGGGVAPKNKVLQVMSPGISWGHELSQAGSSQIALWIMGTSDTNFSGIPLPVDLSLLLGGPASPCMLRTDPTWMNAFITVGGGPGAGFAQFSWQLPGVASYVGLSFYTQWIVFDPLAPNGQLTTTQGVRCICAPVGG